MFKRGMKLTCYNKDSVNKKKSDSESLILMIIWSLFRRRNNFIPIIDCDV